jgi:PPE-repeat protein
MKACQAGGESTKECQCLIPTLTSIDEGKASFLGIGIPGNSNGPPSQQELIEQFSGSSAGTLQDLAESFNCPTGNSGSGNSGSGNSGSGNSGSGNSGSGNSGSGNSGSGNTGTTTTATGNT